MKRWVNRLKRYFRIYHLFVKFSLIDLFIFRINAMVMGLAPIIWLATMIVFLLTIFSRVNNLGGWTFWEIVFLTGVQEVVFLLSWSTFIQNLRTFVDDIRWGRFDYQLLKPLSPRFTASFKLIDFTSWGSLANSLFVFVFAFLKITNRIVFPRLLAFFAFLLIGYWIAYFLYFIFASLALFFIDSRAFMDLVFDTTDFSRYPAEIYAPSVRIFLTFFLPILFFAYFPTAFLLGKISWFYLFLGAAILLILYFVSDLVWQRGLRHYQSASS
ncbi:MAG TPA: ABC-2 family transporter protein [Candidatus Bathyarchaeia archaeon]|nr:ABC-2 family transporter protein [Candidatus Bathyarchaeia archaeon]